MVLVETFEKFHHLSFERLKLLDGDKLLKVIKNRFNGATSSSDLNQSFLNLAAIVIRRLAVRLSDFPLVISFVDESLSAFQNLHSLLTGVQVYLFCYTDPVCS